VVIHVDELRYLGEVQLVHVVAVVTQVVQGEVQGLHRFASEYVPPGHVPTQEEPLK
jgi:hypothetical protein